ncbi:MAG: TIGR02281 family clan AA aspartic protease [Pseudomonadota bacterium]|nr:TIGR02281 family clan AA aspartic protease [Pseudomonadota bacterium]
MASRVGMQNLVREAALWAVAIVGGFAGVYFFDDMRSMLNEGTANVAARMAATEEKPVVQETSSGFTREVSLKASGNGHFYAQARINGRPIAVMVDTGATSIGLRYEDAQELGIHLSNSDFTIATSTANGTTRAAPVTLDSVRIGEVEVRDVKGMVLQPGSLHVTLLGMEFIRKLSKFELQGNRLLLVE